MIDKFDVFINKNTDVYPTQYIASKQKTIAKLFEKNVFKVVTTIEIPGNAQIFNSYFDDKIKNPGIDKVYEKICLVV